ncbi:MAG: inositol monophosphatase [Deltaproteobacteria bacterium]|nr:inositol monophosphatase [Deltaproteobacteria bacterium]
MEPLALAIELARAAGKIQLDRLGKVHQVEYKGTIDLVTEVDKQCERMIVDGIRRHFPDHDVLAEEGTGERSSSANRWIVDPLDGTVNYAHGYPLFCVCIALEQAGQLDLGVVYEPNRDELFVAQRGKGATCNGRPIHVSATSSLIEAMLATGFAYGREAGELAVNIPPWNQFLMRTRAVRRDGVAGADLCYLACGRFDGFWEHYLKPWDIAAGTLIVQEAGGRVTMFDGRPLDIYGTEILASNGALHGTMMEVLHDCDR